MAVQNVKKKNPFHFFQSTWILAPIYLFFLEGVKSIKEKKIMGA